ncbi:hypothetical protein [Maridesulfovibrio sp.]|uniref:hypothetical protein n=1 Tax=Maridesulfovibrio sp. TaxID=2795000 RepID=UPI002A18C3DA|nr:hypothetical protein [Maridesulfovibrio sp.]
MTERKSITLFVDLPEHLRAKEMIAESCGAMFWLFQKYPRFPEIPEYRDKDLKTTRINLSPAAQRYYNLMRPDFETERQLFITAFTILSKMNSVEWKLDLDKYYPK